MVINFLSDLFRIRPWSSDVGSTRQSLTRPWSEADPGQPDQSGPTVQACASTRNPKATPWGVALVGSILAPLPAHVSNYVRRP